MATTVLDVLMEKIDDGVKNTEYYLAAGNAKDYAQYKETVGVIRGLKSAKDFIAEMQTHLEDDDE